MDDATAGGGAGAGAGGGLEAVLVRLVDPATSTRRTAAARTRLANDPTTRALLEAGVDVLLQEIGGPGRRDERSGDHEPDLTGDEAARRAGGLPQARFFEVLSARRVSAAATAAGPLRVTAAHLRDRWAHRSDYVEDLFAYSLWPQHWLATYSPRLRDLRLPQTPEELPPLVSAVADANLVVSRLPVSTRMEVLASALGPVRPALRAARAAAQAQLNATWSVTWTEVFAAAGFRPRSEQHLLDGTRAAAALAEGANLRLMALGDTPENRADAVRLLATGGLALARSCTEPDGSAGPHRPEPRGPLWPARPEGDLADVLLRLTDPTTGTRRTDGARQRLARDGITRQLLNGGLEVLAQEFGVRRPAPGPPTDGAVELQPSRFFDVLSVARVVQAARAAGGAGASASSARLRDRWPNQEHYVDDVVAYAIQRASLVLVSVEGADPPRGEQYQPMMRRAAAAAFAGLEQIPGLRLRLLLTTLARARPVVAARLRDLYEQDDRTQATRIAGLLADMGTRLREGVDLVDLARAQSALGEGMALRALATGDTGEVDAAGETLTLRVTTALHRGAVVRDDGAG